MYGENGFVHGAPFDSLMAAADGELRSAEAGLETRCRRGRPPHNLSVFATGRVQYSAQAFADDQILARLQRHGDNLDPVGTRLGLLEVRTSTRGLPPRLPSSPRPFSACRSTAAKSN
jgi:hypothetical protein